MRYLLISIFSISMLGCRVATVKNFMEIPATKGAIINPYFSDPNQDYLYKTTLSFYGKSFSGILIVKKIALEKHRLVCTTPFGNTLFDITLEPDKHTVNSVIKDLDKKIILNTLVRDFEVLLREARTVTAQYRNENFEVQQHKAKGRYHYYFYKKPGQQLSKIIYTSRYSEKFKVQFDSISNDVAKQIKIVHQNIKLTIQLQFLKK